MTEALQSILLAIGSIACLVLLAQDIRGRWIHLVPVSVLWLAGLGYGWLKMRADFWMNMVVIVVFLSLILGTAWLVMKWRHPQERMMQSRLGWGDVCMFFAMMGWFDPLGYALFFVLGLLFVLLGVVGLMAMGRWRTDQSIPLAGLLGGFALLFAPIYWHFEDALVQWILG